MTPNESGRKGGIITRDNHLTLCPLCGAPKKNEFFAETGKKGGNATLHRRGRDFYSQIGRLGGRGNTKEKRNGRTTIQTLGPAVQSAGK